MFPHTRAGGCTITSIILAAGVSAPLHAQVIRAVTPEAIAEAIRLGEKKTVRHYEMKRLRTIGGEDKKLGGLLRVQFATPFLRVAIGATVARLTGKKFTSADVTPDLIADEIQIIAGCDTLVDGGRVHAVNPSVLSVLRADGTEVAPLRAAETREFPVREVWGRKLNAPLSCRQIIGHYPLDVLDEGIKIRVDALPLNYREAIVTVSSEFRFELAAVR